MPAVNWTTCAAALGSCLRRPLRPLRVGLLGLGVLLVACAGKDHDAYDAGAAKRLFAVGYQDIAEIYIEDVKLEELALAGLERIEQVDPDLAIERTADQLAVRFADHAPKAFRLPESADADAWGDLTASVLTAGLHTSRALDGRNPEQLYEAVFEGMLTRLDRYSRYAGASEARRNRANRDGFGGIGIHLQFSAEGVEVLSVMPGSPAGAAGLAAGDVIVEVGGTPVAELDEDTAITRLRGPVGSSVMLTVRRHGSGERDRLSVERAHIVPRTVTYRREGNAGYVRLSGFNQDTAASLRDVITRARTELGDRLTGYILDLRGNPGGLLDQAVEVSDLFIGQGQIVSTHGRHPDSHQYFDAEPEDVAQGLPVVVLINAGSASASEIVAAALQDSGRGVVVGTTSYGKGTVQTVLRLPNEGELTLTWARFHAPSGYPLSHRGVIPDICTSGSSHSLESITAALQTGQLPLGRSLARKEAPGARASTALRATCPPQRRENALDLEVARRLLQERKLYSLASGKQPPKLAQINH